MATLLYQDDGKHVHSSVGGTKAQLDCIAERETILLDKTYMDVCQERENSSL